LVRPTVRTAAVDRDGNLWVGLAVPYTYVYSPDGDKIRTVQFRAAGTFTPTSLSFGIDGQLLATPGLYEFDPGQQ
jgi:sugar lactone lactonase YvrE